MVVREHESGVDLAVELCGLPLRTPLIPASGTLSKIPALTVDARARKILVRGGLSGPAIKPVALRAVYDVSGVVNIPVIGSGGVVSGTDVAEFMLAGARAVQVGTASFVRDPHEILDEFTAYLTESGLGAAQLTGALRSVRPAFTGS